MDCEDLISLQNRLEKLEKLLFNDEAYNYKNNNVVPTLTDISRKAKETENANIHLKKVYSQLDDLERFASMCHADTLDKPTDAKVAFIEASEKQLRKEAKHLENVEKLKWVLDSEHLKTRITSDLNVKLLQISERQRDQREEVAERLEQTKQLVDNYNKAISAVSNQFEKWNAVVTKLEEQQQIVKE